MKIPNNFEYLEELYWLEVEHLYRIDVKIISSFVHKVTKEKLFLISISYRIGDYNSNTIKIYKSVTEETLIDMYFNRVVKKGEYL